jgi:hypothetical protein
MILQCNKLAMYNAIVTSHLIFITQGTVFIGHPSYVVSDFPSVSAISSLRNKLIGTVETL